MISESTVTRELETFLIQIAEELQLPRSRDSLARSRYESLATYLAEGPLAPFSPVLYAQGSFRILTTVKPLTGEEFDLDFIVELSLPSSVEPVRLYQLVAARIKENGVYAGMIELRPRCVRIRYADEFHMDIVPAVPDPITGGTAILIPDANGSELRWRGTNPKGYVQWFESAARKAAVKERFAVEPLPPSGFAKNKTPLQVGVQLLKRSHHIHVEDEHLRTPSIVLTTIAGLAAGHSESIQRCMDSIVDAMLQHADSPRPLPVYHPAAPHEVLSEKWNDAEALEQFRSHARILARQWADLIASQGRGYPEIVNQLTLMFGEAPVKRAAKAVAERTHAASANSAVLTGGGGLLTLTTPRRGNPPKTFYGDAP